MAKKLSAKKTVKKQAPKKSSPKKLSKAAALVKPKLEAKANASPTAHNYLKVGAKAPAFKLLNQNEDFVQLSDFLGRRVVLYFYPKNDTPGCTQQSCDFRDNHTLLEEHLVRVIGISRDSIESHLKFKSKHQLAQDLLSDGEGKVCEAYGVWVEKSMYGKKYMGIERTSFLISPDGKIEKIYPKVSVPGHVSQIVEDTQSC